VDECSGTACGINAVCINTPGSYDCLCKEGYIGNPFSVCQIVEPGSCDDPSICKCSKDVPCPTGFVHFLKLTIGFHVFYIKEAFGVMKGHVF
jgi:hypothetical protein